MIRRVAEGALIAIVSSAVTLAVQSPGESAQTVRAVVGAVARAGGPWRDMLWVAGLGMLLVGIVLQVLAMAPPGDGLPWDLSVSLPSTPTTLMSAGTVAGLTALAVQLAASDSWASLPVLALVAYWLIRWLDGIRYRWTRLADGL